MAGGIDLDAELDKLFRTPPEGFTAARNALAKALKAEKRKDEAAEVTGLRRPGRLVWALNQLGLWRNEALADMFEAVDDVRDGEVDDFRVAVAEMRAAVNNAASAAATYFDSARPTDRADLTQALLAVVSDEEAMEELHWGRLVDIPPPDAFGLGVTAPTLAPKPRVKAVPTTRAPARQAASDETARPPDQLAIRRAVKRQKEAAKEADQAQRARVRAEKALAADAEALEKADAEVTSATEDLAEAEAALAKARKDKDAADATAASALDAQERSAADLAEAQARTEAAVSDLDAATAELDEVNR